MNANELFNEYVSDANSFAERAQPILQDMRGSISDLLCVASTAQQLTVVGSILMREVSEIISAEHAKLREKQLAKEALWKMSDEEFEGVLRDKYKEMENPLLTLPLTLDERERYQPIINKRVQDALKEAEKNMTEVVQHFTFSPKRDIY